jgi:hypothetical protein
MSACGWHCSSFYFAKGWHFVCRFNVHLFFVVSSFRVSANICGYETPPVAYFVYISFVRRVLAESRGQINNFVQTVKWTLNVFVGNRQNVRIDLRRFAAFMAQ